MDDRYRIDDETARPEHRPRDRPVRRVDSVDLALWIVLMGGVLFNSGLQFAGLEFAAIPFGAAAAGAGVALIVRYLKRRR